MPQFVFNPNRLKIHLKLAVNRLKLVQQKKNVLNKQARKDIAALLENSKEESAKIRVEGIIREDYYIEAMEMLELYCELLLARFGLLEQMNEAVNTLIYAAPRSEIKELSLVRDQLIAKFGKEFALNAIENKNNCVNEKLIQKLMFSTADSYLVNSYLEEIAKSYNVNWQLDPSVEDSLLGMDFLNTRNKTELTALPDMELLLSLNNDKGGNSQLSSITSSDSDCLVLDIPSLQPPDNKKNNKHDKLASNNSVKTTTRNSIPKSTTKFTTKSTDGLPDFDELERRFEALKRK
ncbi:22245_t:CDS:2 [Cetraspora pellucida]|uniref:22245_t:CDS:1 n=1 Tax=Cetraspora pellucida TaxID=1433469 RepID=A0A9N9F9V4_9GLOM|nr:22245_t:CDS:2 [Cetraspora pellucida]